jgi:hypothetical protein
MTSCSVNPAEGGVLMSSMRSEFSENLLAADPYVERPMLRRRRSRTLARVLITFCAGVATTLAWQSYGDAAREIIANSYPQLGWLAPRAAIAQTAPDTIVPGTTSLDQQELKAMLLGLAVVQQRVDQLAAQVAAGQDQVTRDIVAKLQEVEQDMLQKISAPPSRPDAVQVRKPVPSPAQAAPLR